MNENANSPDLWNQGDGNVVPKSFLFPNHKRCNSTGLNTRHITSASPRLKDTDHIAVSGAVAFEGIDDDKFSHGGNRRQIMGRTNASSSLTRASIEEKYVPR